MPDGTTVLLWITVAVALGFDFTNGFHDTATAVATSISTRALSPRVAIAMSAVLNLAGALVATQVLHTRVADTIGGLVKPPGGVGLGMIIAALVGAIVWNLVTWRAGLPSSSSHALIGALIGMGLAGYGLQAVQWTKVGPVVIGLISSPLIGMVGAYAFMVVLLNVFRRSHPSRANRRFRRAQVLSAAFVSFSHGANDAQKTMGIITLALLSTGRLTLHGRETFPAVPLWVAVAAAGAIGLGTYAGGWRIIRTLGSRIIHLEPDAGFAAQTVAAVVIQGATQAGLPVSTTHVVSGCVLGAGATRRLAAVRWDVARSILIAWVLTIPAAALVAGGLALPLR
ncbi:MAG: phosphate transporter [Chloroflexi bacterium]|jgi:PiT family inorganic phosphate transporter|nr:phosphate transporter [Chloroflexota bacterium]